MSLPLIMLVASLVAADGGEESTLTAARLQTNDKALLDFFHKRTPPALPRDVIEKLVHTLSSADAAEADVAQSELIRLGACAVPLVREVANRIDDARSAARAKQVLEWIEGPQADSLPIEAARLLAKSQPAGVVKTLLDYLPFADNDRVFEEVESTLSTVGFHQGKANVVLLAALKDRRAVRRAAAARIFCRTGSVASVKAIRPLLHDAEPSVRFQAAQALANIGDAEAIGLLIDSLATASLLQQKQAEEYLTNLAGEWAVIGPRGDDPIVRQLRCDIWTAWWRSMTGEKLLKVFQSRMLEEPEARTSATPVPDVVFRLLRLRRPEGTVTTLLAFLPRAKDEEMIGRIVEILSDVGVVDGKPDEALVKALQDRIAIRRVAAAIALCRGRAAEVLSSLRKLLADEDIEVRRRVAWELASSGDKEAAVVLSGLLAELPSERALEIEEFLEKLAGGKAPSDMTRDPVNWKKVASFWTEWWKDDKNKIALVDTDAMDRGYTLAIQHVPGTVTELDRNGKPRWTLTGLNQPRDALLLPGSQRMLVTEQDRVTERDLRGKILWQKEGLPGVGCVQRLRNGNTLITCPGQNSLIEVDRKGQEVMHVDIGGTDWTATTRKLRNGSMVMFNGRGAIAQLDKTGRTVKTTQVQANGNTSAEILDNGHVLVPFGNAITEYDVDGKQIRRLSVPKINHLWQVSCMFNGHILALGASQGRGECKCVELNRNGQLVKETTLPGQNQNQVWRVKRR
jgi:HEAT repeats